MIVWQCVCYFCTSSIRSRRNKNFCMWLINVRYGNSPAEIPYSSHACGDKVLLPWVKPINVIANPLRDKLFIYDLSFLHAWGSVLHTWHSLCTEKGRFYLAWMRISLYTTPDARIPISIELHMRWSNEANPNVHLFIHRQQYERCRHSNSRFRHPGGFPHPEMF